MPDEFSDFLDTPNAQTYLRLRDVIYASDVFDMTSTALGLLEQAVREERFEDVRAIQETLMPNFLLSPRAHLLLGQAATARGEAARGTSETRMGEACLIAMRSTGDGSRQAPYQVMHPADGHDLASIFERAVVGHRSEVIEGAALNVLICDDESEIWIDMTKSTIAMAQTAMRGV